MGAFTRLLERALLVARPGQKKGLVNSSTPVNGSVPIDRMRTMMNWEYKKIALNEATRRSDDIDLLCDAGEAGWELVAVLPNGVAYLKREVTTAVPEMAEHARDVEQAEPE